MPHLPRTELRFKINHTTSIWCPLFVDKRPVMVTQLFFLMLGYVPVGLRLMGLSLRKWVHSMDHYLRLAPLKFDLHWDGSLTLKVLLCLLSFFFFFLGGACSWNLNFYDVTNACLSESWLFLTPLKKIVALLYPLVQTSYKYAALRFIVQGTAH